MQSMVEGAETAPGLRCMSSSRQRRKACYRGAAAPSTACGGPPPPLCGGGWVAPVSDAPTLLRFLTCGSVDDGKSTLIGRLLNDAGRVFDDHRQALERDSRRHGTTGDEPDLALLLDGLQAEREQGITIDVAWRYFSTARRRFIVADAPGHEQYTRNMAVAASNVDVAVVLVDARRGVVRQTRRHSFIAALLGVRHIVLAVNKMDLVGFDRDVFRRIQVEYGEMAERLGLQQVTGIPLSARRGDNVAQRSDRLDWFDGPTLLEHLETVEVGEIGLKPFRFPVQMVQRPSADFRGYAGIVASGAIRPGEPVVVARSGVDSRIARIVTADGDLDEAVAGQAVTLVLEGEVDVSRGDLLCPPSARPDVADQFTARLIWFDEAPLLPGREYLLRTEVDEVPASITDLKHRLNVETFAEEAARTLAINEIGRANLWTRRPLAFDAYADNRSTGGFLLIDRATGATAGAGMIVHPLRRATNVHWQAIEVDAAARARLKGQSPAVVWFTGLSGSGKSTIANLLEKKLHAQGRHTVLLDGDNLRHGLNKDLGFTEADRVENIRRVAEVARLMADAGLIVLTAFISPFAAERRMARELMGDVRFIEVFVDTPLEECIRRDPKGLYARALAGEIANFTGVGSPYEAPETPDVHLLTSGRSPEELADAIEARLRREGLI